MGTVYYVGTCPHCLAAKRTFTACGQSLLRKNGNGSRWRLQMSCGSCARRIDVLLASAGLDGPLDGPGTITLPRHGGQAAPGLAFIVQAVYPKPRATPTPFATPLQPADRLSAARVRLIKGDFEACAALCVSALDLASQDLLPGISGLRERFHRLRNEGVIPPTLAAWGHFVRIEGSAATLLDEDVAEEEAQELLDFTETFLLFAFSRPGAGISNRRLRAS
jgi:hypothetical protein